MANQDNEFNFYNSENDGYRGGFGGYTDSNPNQSQGGPEAPQGPQKHRGSGRRIAALILACAVVGGGAGVGGAALYSSVFASQPSVIYQNTQPISTQADPVASSSGQAMTPEQLYAANVDACVGITVSTTMTNIFGYTSTSAASGSGENIVIHSHPLNTFPLQLPPTWSKLKLYRISRGTNAISQQD